jgi:energy-coupling factor transporter ATP-binding protein EcfA2
MAFCLAGALSFNLANPESADNTPVFAQLMLDEAFSKSDPQFAQQALQAFRKLGFQLVIVATVQNATTIQPYIDSVVMVSKTEATAATSGRSRRWRPGRSRNSPRCAMRWSGPPRACRLGSDIAHARCASSTNFAPTPRNCSRCPSRFANSVLRREAQSTP